MDKEHSVDEDDNVDAHARALEAINAAGPFVDLETGEPAHIYVLEP